MTYKPINLSGYLPSTQGCKVTMVIHILLLGMGLRGLSCVHSESVGSWNYYLQLTQGPTLEKLRVIWSRLKFLPSSIRNGDGTYAPSDSHISWEDRPFDALS